MTVNIIARKVRAIIALPRHLRRGNANRKTHARLAPPPAANQPSNHLCAAVCLLLCGCAGVVLTVSETCPVPVIDFGSIKHAAWVRLDGMVQERAISEV